MATNTQQYSWADVNVVMGGRLVTGITGVEYNEKSEKKPLYGRGNKPHAIVSGNREYEGKITLWQSELEAMTRDAENKDVLSLCFNITIAYVPEDGGQIVTDLLMDCEITEIPKAMNQGDTNMLIELPITFTNVKRQQ